MLTEEQVKAFCGGRFEQPMPWDGTIIATDAAIAIQAEKSVYTGASEPNGKAEAASKSINANYSERNPIPMPTIPPRQPDMPCEKCHGTGDLGKCPDCHGQGYVDYEYFSPSTKKTHTEEHECPTCEGNSGCCPKCDGARIIEPKEEKQGVRIETGARVELRYLRAIAALPNVELFHDPDWQAVSFRFNGGRGVAMVMR